MAAFDAAFFAAAGGSSLAIAATLWALAQRRSAQRAADGLLAKIDRLERRADAADASTEAFDSAVMVVDGSGPRLTSGAHSLADCAEVLGLPRQAGAAEVWAALCDADPDHDRKLAALKDRGEPCTFEAQGPAGGRVAVVVEGRAAGAFAWLRLSVSAGAGLPSAARFAAFLDAQAHAAWIVAGDGRLAWANRAWLAAAEAESVEDAVAAGRMLDQGFAALAAEAAHKGEVRENLIWAAVGGRRRAYQVSVQPLEGGGAAALAVDVTESEELKETLKRHVAAHDETLNRLADAVAIFGPDRRLSFFNTAFAELWDLEPAWLADKPSHAEVLDRLRQRRRLPETADYAQWKARELSFYESLDAAPDEQWSLPGGRTLRVVRQPHPFGGVLLLFSDITDELRLKAQFNAQVQVQKATLDKLNDAVAVFGSDGRLRLTNEAFERFWGPAPLNLKAAADFDQVVELCTPIIHDLQFWRELKARVADPDPQARAPIAGETRTSDRRVVAFQTRPLPDGATLVGFSDITATRELEQAVLERSEALAESQRLKREFVGNVSYELRTPLTTIIGYSELLEMQAAGVSDAFKSYVGAVRQAATQLASSIDDVLDMAQIDAGEMALSLGDVDVAELLAEAVRRNEPLAASSGVVVVSPAAETLGTIRADARRLTQVMDHLVANAIRSTPRGGEVFVEAVRDQGEVQLTVRDTGRGIPFHVQAHVFDRFVGRDRGGPGLGLALVKALIELHGGWVALESAPGQGAAFTCHVPEEAMIEAAQPELRFG